MTDPHDKIGRYVLYMAERQGITVDEAAAQSLTGVNRVTTSEGCLALLTAFRPDWCISGNRSRNFILYVGLHNLGWGALPVQGVWLDTGEVEELFVVAGLAHNKRFDIAVRELLAKHEQESAVVKLPRSTEAILLHVTGSEIILGPWTPDKLAEYYATMRKGGAFRFWAAGDFSVMTMLGMDVYFRRKVGGGPK